MSDPLPLGRQAAALIRNNSLFSIALAAAIFTPTVSFFGSKQANYAMADTNAISNVESSPLFDGQSQLFEPIQAPSEMTDSGKTDSDKSDDGSNKPFAQKIYALVGNSPIRDMVPFISQRDQKVAAFLVGIADKESGLGSDSPSKDGKTCYNYWGYKGEGGRGDGMGYACFASAQEAVETVGDRIQNLVDNNNRTTPAKMVDTWKCGTSCEGDPGAPGWVSTVALYFNKIVDQNG